MLMLTRMSSVSLILVVCGIASIFGFGVLVVETKNDQGNPLVNESKSDLHSRVKEGDEIVFKCEASYPVKWIRLYPQDNKPAHYRFSQLINETVDESKTAEGNSTSNLRLFEIHEDQHPFLYACIASVDADNLKPVNGVLTPNITNRLRLTKVHLKIVVKDAMNFDDAAGGSTSDCPFWTRKKALTAEALIQTLNGDLLASRSATTTLEKWCADHKLAPVAKIVATQINVGQAPEPPSNAKLLLQLGDNDTVRYRLVELSCGDRILSVADNWYVSNRLTPAMNYALDNTNTPFGKVIASLEPFRQTSAVNFLWRPLPDGWEMKCSKSSNEDNLPMPDRILEHQATVLTKAGLPISFVDERYTNKMFDFL